MENIINYPYKSVLAHFIYDYIKEKRSLGYIYNAKAYQLYKFDQYWLKNGDGSTNITLEKINDWLCALPNESKSSQNSRICAIKGLANYLNIHGVTCCIPLEYIRKNRPIIHILSKNELHELFNVIDSYALNSINSNNYRMAYEYQIIFRLYYCCGMRNNEVCSLKTSDIDIEKGVITIYNGKGNKDRLIYLPEDLRKVIDSYYKYIAKTIGDDLYWFFPGKNYNKCISRGNIEHVFKNFWNKTSASKICDKAPTPHSLRHGFVVDRLNKWILEGIDINVMSIYLSKYLGHTNPDMSYYYYHLTSDAFRIIHQKDSLSNQVLPEVRRR